MHFRIVFDASSASYVARTVLLEFSYAVPIDLQTVCKLNQPPHLYGLKIPEQTIAMDLQSSIFNPSDIDCKLFAN